MKEKEVKAKPGRGPAPLYDQFPHHHPLQCTWQFTSNDSSSSQIPGARQAGTPPSVL